MDAEGKLWIEPTAASIVAATHHWPDPGKRQEDLPLARLLDDAHNFGLQLLDVLAHEA